MLKKVAYFGLMIAFGCAGLAAQGTVPATPTKVPATALHGPQATKGQVAATRARLKIKPGTPQAGPKITNSQAALQNAAAIAVLQKQRQAADVEAAQMKLRIHPASQAGLTPEPSRPMSASGGAGSINPNTTYAGAIQKGSATGNQRPSRPTEGPANTSPRFSQMGQVNTTPMICAHDPTMRILKVSGEAAPATFTTDARYNFYTITGCSFGNPGPNSKVYIYYRDTFHQEFQIQEWNDNGINLNLNPSLSGLLDQDNLTLVVQRADGKQASKTGYKFFAAREKLHLNSVPQRFFSLDKFALSLTNTSQWQLYYASPPSPTQIPWIRPGMSTAVEWDEGLGFVKGPFDKADMPSGGQDYWDFSRLAPGFAVTDAALTSVTLNCSEYGGTLLTAGNFDVQWAGPQKLLVKWQGQNCKDDLGCGHTFQGDCFVTHSAGTLYGLDVFVEGPRGIDPWTGKPTGR